MRFESLKCIKMGLWQGALNPVAGAYSSPNTPLAKCGK